ncbi:MAG: DegV family protein [Bacillota bacterium]|nr:DegV family protein [Bacillota bacterium]
MKIRVLTDSAGCLSKEQAEAYGIDFLPLQVIVEGKTYLDGADITNSQLYDMMEKGAFPQTSQAPLGMIEELFSTYEKEGVTDVILVTLSPALSGTNENICAAAMRYGIKIHTTDTYSTLHIEQYWARCAKALVDQGVEPEEIIRRLNNSIAESKGFLVVEDLAYLAKGGRLTPLAAKFGGMLKIVPILEVSKETGGKVDMYEKVRTMPKAIKTAVKTITSNMKGNAQEYYFVLMDSRASQSAQLAQKELLNIFPELKIERDDICAVINCHTGMGSVGMQFAKKVEGVEL